MGAGSWGTALAKHMADMGHEVRLWSRRKAQAERIQQARENHQYLPGHPLPPTLLCTHDVQETLDSIDLAISVVPSQSTRKVWENAQSQLPAGVPLLCASKGIENNTLALMLQVLEAAAPNHPLGFIGGPSFAKEVASRQPTALVIGSRDREVAEFLQAAVSSDWVRAYASHDTVGIEIGGALKNVIAIACGCADGLGLGLNSRAALITRGLAEITRLAMRMGADPLSLSGLAGMGDLVLTCTGDLSRNRRVGIGLGQGQKLDDILQDMGQVAEGVKTTLSAKQLADREGVEMPITQEMYRVIYENKPAREVVLSLMRRSLKSERE